MLRYSRFIKPDPNAEDPEHTSIAQEVQDENEGRSKVPGSNPTDDYRPYWIVQWQEVGWSEIVAKWLKAKDIVEPHEGIEDTIANDLKGVLGAPTRTRDSALKLVSFYVPRGEERRPFLYFVPARRAILVK